MWQMTKIKINLILYILYNGSNNLCYIALNDEICFLYYIPLARLGLPEKWNWFLKKCQNFSASDYNFELKIATFFVQKCI